MKHVSHEYGDEWIYVCEMAKELRANSLANLDHVWDDLEPGDYKIGLESVSGYYAAGGVVMSSGVTPQHTHQQPPNPYVQSGSLYYRIRML